MSQPPNRPPKGVKLSEDEIHMRAQSLRTTRRTGDSGTAGKVADTVGDVSRSVAMRLLWLLRFPLMLIAGGLGFAFFNTQEWTNFAGALALSVVVALLTLFIITRIIRYMDYVDYRNSLSR